MGEIVLVLLVILAVAAIGTFMAFVSRYRRCPSNKILVIYGKTSSGAAKCIHGGAAFVWPLIQDFAYLYLEPFVVPIDLTNALSQENIRVTVPTSVTARRISPQRLPVSVKSPLPVSRSSQPHYTTQRHKIVLQAHRDSSTPQSIWPIARMIHWNC